MTEKSTQREETALKNQPPGHAKRRYLRRPQAADYINMSIAWLAQAACTGDGPPFIKAGNVSLYDIQDLDAFMLARKVTSTSQKAA